MRWRIQWPLTTARLPLKRPRPQRWRQQRRRRKRLPKPSVLRLQRLLPPPRRSKSSKKKTRQPQQRRKPKRLLWCLDWRQRPTILPVRSRCGRVFSCVCVCVHPTQDSHIRAGAQGTLGARSGIKGARVIQGPLTNSFSPRPAWQGKHLQLRKMRPCRSGRRLRFGAFRPARNAKEAGDCKRRSASFHYMPSSLDRGQEPTKGKGGRGHIVAFHDFTNQHNPP